MEVKPGYKQTEVGVIPVDWGVVQIVEVADMITVGFVGSMSHLFTKQGIPLLRGQNVLPNKLDLTEMRYINEDTHKRWKKSSLISGDVVMVRVGYPGTSCVIPKGFGEANAASLVIVRPSKNKIRSSFLSLVINSNFGKRQIDSYLVGGAQQVFNTTTAAAFKLPLPKTKEQDAIAEALSDADALIESLEQLIAKKRQIKQGAMQELLTGKRRLSRFSGEWELKTLGCIGKLRGGNGFPISYQGEVDGIYPFYKVSDMNNEGNSVVMKDANNWISEGTRNKIGANTFPKNTLVFARIGAAVFLERKRILSRESCIDNNMMGFITDTKVAFYKYMHYLFQTIQFSNLVATTALPSINGKDIAVMGFYIPPINEQVAITEVLDDFDVQIFTLEDRLAKFRQIKQGMIQELLTGRIRLI